MSYSRERKCAFSQAKLLLFLKQSCHFLCRWAQDLAGMDILSTLPPSLTAAHQADVLEQLSIHRRQQRIQVVLERLQAGKVAMLALK